MTLVGLALYLSSGQPVDKGRSEAWFASEEGRTFLTSSGQRWCDADIAAGADPDEARAAAERTTAAQTGAA